jgi:hypothetical protein
MRKTAFGQPRTHFTIVLISWMSYAGCGQKQVSKPDLPASISPGWKLTSYDPAAAPAGMPRDSSPQCWKANYEGEGTIAIWLCGYSAEGGAFNAVQRTPTQAQTVKFQEGRYFVLVQWNAVPKASLTALVRTIQANLRTR